jgi:hypothetical protein
MDGAKLSDPTGLFNASLDGGTRRAIDLREGEMVDAGAFRDLVGGAKAVTVTQSRHGGNEQSL